MAAYKMTPQQKIEIKFGIGINLEECQIDIHLGRTSYSFCIVERRPVFIHRDKEVHEYELSHDLFREKYFFGLILG